MKQRLQKTICYILLFTGLGFYIINGIREPDSRFPVFSCHYKIVLSGMRNDPLPDSSATV